MGLNDRDAVERAFDASLRCLRPGGLLVIGWNDVPDRRPFPLDECDALAQFDRYTWPALGTADHLTATDNRHTFSFYRRPPADAPVPAVAAASGGRFHQVDVASFLSSLVVTLTETPAALLACI